jgi:DNA-binding NarL/FixJ family response regulator
MHPNPETITVLLADDHPLARKGMQHILANAANISIVGEAQDGKEIRELVAKLCPKILLLDLKMPGTSPFEIEKWVRENHPETITLVLTAHDRDCYLAGMMDAGVAGYLHKTEKADCLIAAIRRAAQGEEIFTAEQINRARKWRLEAGEKWEKLTKREREILLLVAQGQSNQTIAKKLGITLKTVAYHVSAILNRLDTKSRNEAVAWLHKHSPDDPE